MAVRLDYKPRPFTPDRLSFWEGAIAAAGLGAWMWLLLALFLL